MGLAMALMLKHSQLRKFSQIETCLITLMAYGSYFFSNALRMSGISPSMEGTLILGIVSLLFCGITLKHYAYHNMSRRTRLGTKYIFQILAQMSENFIFIYLGLSLFTMRELVFKPTIIVITTVTPASTREHADNSSRSVLHDGVPSSPHPTSSTSSPANETVEQAS